MTSVEVSAVDPCREAAEELLMPAADIGEYR
jgi:hypothetical protein